MHKINMDKPNLEHTDHHITSMFPVWLVCLNQISALFEEI